MRQRSFVGRFVRFLQPYKLQIAALLLFQVIIIACSLTVPYVLGDLIEVLERNGATISVLKTAFFKLVAVYLLWNSSSVILESLSEFINKSIENDIRTHCYKSIILSPMARLQGKTEGEVITRVMRDTERLEKAFSSLFSLLDLTLYSVGTIVMMFMVNYVLASVVVALFALIAVVQRATAEPLKQLYRKYKSSEEGLLTNLRNQVFGFMTIKVHSLEQKAIDSLRRGNEENLKYFMGIQVRASIIRNVNFFFAALFRVSSIVIGGFLYLAHMITIGGIFAVYTYSIQISNRLRNIIEIDIVLKDIETSFGRVTDFLEEFETRNTATSGVIDSIDRIEFRCVTYGYDERTLLSDLSFRAQRGSTVGIRGRNGSGKTTLVYLICGFYKADGVYINDVPTHHLSEAAILGRISYALQDTYLFPTTIMENLTCFGAASEQAAMELAEEIGLHAKIMALPKGYQTVVNEKNLNLSGGEKQLIGLVRALLRDSDVLILDEINSALDLRTEDELLRCISSHFRGRMVFIISHRAKMFDICNTIIDLDSGTVSLCEHSEYREVV